MLLWLTEFLQQLLPTFRVFQYLTFRSILATLTALSIALLIGPAMIRRLAQYKVGQQIRDDGPQSHLTKAGTPTMGGALILISIAVSTLLWCDLANVYIWIVLLTTLGFGIVGGVDDYRKLVLGDSRGLPARWKIFLASHSWWFSCNIFICICGYCGTNSTSSTIS